MKYLHVLLCIPMLLLGCFYIFLVLADNVNFFLLLFMVGIAFLILLYFMSRLNIGKFAWFIFILPFLIIGFIIAISTSEVDRKRDDTTIKASFINLRSKAEIYYLINDSSYSGVCNSKEFIKIKEDISRRVINFDYACNDTGAHFAVEVFAKEIQKYICMDSSSPAIYNNELSIGSNISCSAED